MNQAASSFPSETRRAWLNAIKSAALFEGTLAAVFLAPLVVPIPMFSGADNPLWFYLAGLFHLPFSLLFPVLYDAASQWLPNSTTAMLLVPCVLVAVAQFSLVAVALRMRLTTRARLSSSTSLERTRER